MTPPVSVVVPTFQRREFVLRAVRSVLAQSFRDFELVVVDDGSTDGTGEVLAGLDRRIRYLWQANRGPGAARNAGVRAASGPVVAFLDSDNRWLPGHLAVCVETLERFPEAVLVSTCPRMHVAGRQRPCEATLVDFLPFAYSDTWAGLTSCMAVRCDELERVGGFDESMVVLEDVHLWLRLAERGPFAFVQHRTVRRQQTRGSRFDRAVAAGAVLDAFGAISRAGLEVAEQTGRPDRDTLLGLAEGRLRYTAALRALVERDAEAFAAHAAAACRRLPALSREPEVVAYRIAAIAPDAVTRASCLALAAGRWPDEGSPTAIFLRWKAVAAAVRLRRWRDVAALLRGWPFRQTPRVVLGDLRRWARLVRRAARRRRNRADESAALAAWFSDHGGR